MLGVMAPMNVVLTLVPRVTNYRKPWETEKAARGATSHALHLFQHLITLTPWAISGYLKGIDQPDPRWVKVLLDKGFPPAMVEMLRDSPDGTFSTRAPRVGTTVNLFNEQSMCSEWSRPISASTSSGATATGKGGGPSRTYQPDIFWTSGSGRTVTQATRTSCRPLLWPTLLNKLGLFGDLFLSAPCLFLPVDPARKKVKIGRTSLPTRKFPTRKRRCMRL